MRFGEGHAVPKKRGPSIIAGGSAASAAPAAEVSIRLESHGQNLIGLSHLMTPRLEGLMARDCAGSHNRWSLALFEVAGGMPEAGVEEGR